MKNIRRRGRSFESTGNRSPSINVNTRGPLSGEGKRSDIRGTETSHTVGGDGGEIVRFVEEPGTERGSEVLKKETTGSSGGRKLWGRGVQSGWGRGRFFQQTRKIKITSGGGAETPKKVMEKGTSIKTGLARKREKVTVRGTNNQH